MSTTTNRPTRHMDAWFGALGAALVTCSFIFAALGTPPLPPAPLLGLGMPSPLTGMTRSFVALAGGDIGRAFAMHPLGPLTFAACVVAVINLAFERGTGRRPAVVTRALAVPYAPWILAAAFVAVWIRKILAWP